MQVWSAAGKAWERHGALGDFPQGRLERRKQSAVVGVSAGALHDADAKSGGFGAAGRKKGPGRKRRRAPEGDLSVAFAALTASAELAALAAAARTVLAGASDIDSERAAIDLLAMQTFDGPLGLLSGAHGYKAEAARATGGAVHHQVGLEDGAEGSEGILKIILRGVIGDVPNKQFFTHAMYMP